MSRPYFVAKKWVYDPAARRRANKAHDVLEAAKQHIYNTGTYYPCDIDLDGDSEAAVLLLNRASKDVGAAEIAAHKAAKEREAR